MVFFTCNSCGEALKKNQVEKHYMQKCRSCNVLSCVDCGKDFYGNDYEKHTKCITEEEKYEGKNFKPKPNANKGELKQELWIQQVQAAIDKAKTNVKLRGLLESLKNYPNIPRKKAKFENFLANSLRVRDSYLAGQAWDAIAAELSAQNMNTSVSETVQLNGPAADKQTKSELEIKENGTASEEKSEKKKSKKQKQEADSSVSVNDAIITKKKSKKRKHDALEENGEPASESVMSEMPATVDKKSKKKRKKQRMEVEDQPASVEQSCDLEADSTCTSAEAAPLTADFKWEAAIIGILRRSPEKTLSLKKLRKKVLAEFNARGGDGKFYSEEKLLAKFTRKVTHNTRFKVHKEHVTLVS